MVFLYRCYSTSLEQAVDSPPSKVHGVGFSRNDCHRLISRSYYRCVKLVVKLANCYHEIWLKSAQAPRMS